MLSSDLCRLQYTCEVYMHKGKTLRHIKIKQINLKTILNRKKKGQTLPFCPLTNPKTLEPGKVTFFVLLLATRDSGGSDHSPPPSVYL